MLQKTINNSFMFLSVHQFGEHSCTKCYAFYLRHMMMYGIRMHIGSRAQLLLHRATATQKKIKKTEKTIVKHSGVHFSYNIINISWTFFFIFYFTNRFTLFNISPSPLLYFAPCSGLQRWRHLQLFAIAH